MPALIDHQSSETTKLLLIGHSGAGKTGALCSLASAGYNLRIIDLDNGLDILRNMLTAPNSPYAKDSASRVHYKTLTEPMKAINGVIRPTRATVWKDLTGLLTHWKDGDTDLGPITSWGQKDILTIDSLTGASNAALNFHQAMNGRLGKSEVSNEWRRDIGAAQGYVENLLQLLYDSEVKCNVIVISHIALVDDQEAPPALPGESRPQQGFPSALGKALSPKIPRYFNSVIQAKVEGSGPSARHKLFTKSRGIVNCKSSAPLKVADSYDLSTGLAEYFKAVRS